MNFQQDLSKIKTFASNSSEDCDQIYYQRAQVKKTLEHSDQNSLERQNQSNIYFERSNSKKDLGNGFNSQLQHKKLQNSLFNNTSSLQQSIHKMNQSSILSQNMNIGGSGQVSMGRNSQIQQPGGTGQLSSRGRENRQYFDTLKFQRPETQQFNGQQRRTFHRQNVSSQHQSRLSLKKSNTQQYLGSLGFASVGVQNQSEMQTAASAFQINSTLMPFKQQSADAQLPPTMYIDHNNQMQILNPQPQVIVEQSLTKDEKLNLLKQRRQEKELKIKSKLDIYTSVRPFKASKEKEKAQNEYLLQMQRHGREPQLDHLYGTNPLTKYQTVEVSKRIDVEVARLPLSIKSQHSQRQKQVFTPLSNEITKADINTVTTQCSPTKQTSYQNTDDLGPHLTIDSKISPMSHNMSKQSNFHFKSNSMTFRFNQLEMTLRKEKQALDHDFNMRYSDGENELIDDFLGETSNFTINDKEPKLNLLKYIIKGESQALVKDLEKVISQVQRRQIINERDGNGRSALFYAVIKGQYDISEILLRNGAETQFRDRLGRTILHTACMKNCDKNMVEMILTYQKSQPKLKLIDKYSGKLYDIAPITVKAKTLTSKVRNPQLDQIRNINVIEEEQNSQNLSQSINSMAQSTLTTPQVQSKTKNRLLSARRGERNTFEQQLKSSQQYMESLENYINYTDSFGKTALHYAVRSDNLQVVKSLFSKGANIYIRDYKQRKPLELWKSQEVYDYLQNEEQAFQDNYDKMSKSSQDVLASSKLKSESTPSKQQKILELSSQEALSSYANNQLSQFVYGIYLDNALTYMIRMEDKQKFEYLLGRGILASICDSDGYNALHYAIKMEKFTFISFLLEGDYQAFESERDFYGDLTKLQITFTNMTMNKSYMMATYSQMGQTTTQQNQLQKSNYQLDALLALDKSSMSEGCTPFHEAVKTGNIKILEYLFRVLQKRNEFIENKITDKKVKEINERYHNALLSIKSLKDVMEFTDKQNMTLLLIAAKYNHLEIVKYLIKEGANPYVQCSQLNNPLHYAVQNQNHDMIQFLISADAESGILRNEKNYKNFKPENYDTYKKFTSLFSNIFELITLRTQQQAEKIQQLLRHQPDKYKSDMKTFKGQNTPLHFAVIHNNLRALKVLVQNLEPGRSIDIQNADGKTPRDFAMMYKSEEERNKIMMILHKEFSQTQNPSASPRNRKKVSVVMKHSFSKVDNQTTDFTKLHQFLNVASHKQTSLEDLDQITEFCESDIGNYLPDSPLMPPRKNDSFLSGLKLRATPNYNDTVSERDITENQQPIQNGVDFTMKMRQESEQTSRNNLNQLSLADMREIEVYIQKKHREYQNEQRLGNFNPELYTKIFNKQTSSSGQNGLSQHAPSLNSSTIQGFNPNFKKQRSLSRRRNQVKELFAEIDVKCKKYIEYAQIEEQWGRFEEILGQNDLRKLKQYLERYYMETKITLACFLKLMNFYVNDN